MSLEVFSDTWNACSRNQINKNRVCYYILFYTAINAASLDRETIGNVILVQCSPVLISSLTLMEIETIKTEMYDWDQKLKWANSRLLLATKILTPAKMS